MKTAFGAMYMGLASFGAAGVAWVLMWLTDRLYGGSFWWLAVPLRIIIFLDQVVFLLAMLATVVGVVWATASIFYRASRAQNSDDGSTLSVKGYMLVLLLPLAMALTSALVVLFSNWLDFNAHGLGFIYLAYGIFDWVLELGSLLVVGTWLVVLPIFLRRRSTASDITDIPRRVSESRTTKEMKILSPIKVLIVDDHKVVRDAIANWLINTDDIKVVGDAADGLEGLRKAGSLLPDIVITNIAMPEMDGIELARQIAQKYPSCKVIILTLRDQYLTQALDAGAMGYLLKDIPLKELAQAIRRVYSGQLVISEAVKPNNA